MKDRTKLLSKAQLEQYLTRINYTAPNAKEMVANLKLLQELHECHVFSIPFENISMHLPEAVKIDIESLHSKIISTTDNTKRGGYCYEMNALFFALLNDLGFDVELHLAELSQDGIFNHDGSPTHAINIVTIEDKKYLVDVAYGRNALIHPIALDLESDLIVYSTSYSIKSYSKNEYVYGVNYGGLFHPEYRFDLTMRPLNIGDLQAYSDRLSIDESSPLYKTVLISKPTKYGRITLNNAYLKVIDSVNGNFTQCLSDSTTYCDTLNSLDVTLSRSDIAILFEKVIANTTSSSLPLSKSMSSLRSNSLFGLMTTEKESSEMIYKNGLL